MKIIFKQILKYYLKIITKIVLAVHRPIVIGIAGSNNKPFVKEEIKKVLIDKGLNVRANPKNFNTEIGLPLAVLNLPSGYNSFLNWLPAILNAPKRIWQKGFPQYLVLELGTSDPGDMKYLLSIIRPTIVIITDINQRYLESFFNMNQLVKEYEFLINQTPQNGLVILNFDNIRIKAISPKTNAKVISFSTIKKSDRQAFFLEKTTIGQKFILIKGNTRHSITLKNKYGRHHVYSYLIAQIIKDYAL